MPLSGGGLRVGVDASAAATNWVQASRIKSVEIATPAKGAFFIFLMYCIT